MAMMRSGRWAAIFSIGTPSVAGRTVGTLALPSAALAHGKIAPGCLPNHSVVATGTTPSARSASCSRRPATTTRSGWALMVVVPYLWVIVTGNALASGAAVPLAADDVEDEVDESPHALSARVSTPSRTGRR